MPTDRGTSLGQRPLRDGMRAGFIGLGLISLVGIQGQTVLESAKAEDTLIPVITPQGARILTELADTPEKRARGFMFRDSLARDRGMLFTFPEPQHWTFWMKSTKIPLDIIWLDRSKKVVHLERNVPTCSRTDDGCPQYQPNEEAMYVLEVAAGMAAALGIERGVKLKFEVASPLLEFRPHQSR